MRIIRTWVRLIFPNPTERYLELRFAEEGHRNLFVYDLYGALIFSSESSSRQAILDLELLHTGIYLLTIQGSEGTKTSKIIVETR